MVKIHRITDLDHIKAERKKWHPFYDRTGNIENYFSNWMKKYKNLVSKKNADWIYLPIRFVNFHRTVGLKAARPIIAKIPGFKENSHKYFTVCQWVGGTCMELHNTKLFMATATNDTHIPIPLCTDEHPNQKKRRKYLASFVGNLRNHITRSRIANRFKDDKDIVIKNAKTNLKLFRDLLNSAIFTLCPRGVGPGSFRIFEAFHVGTVPVIISDDYRRPYADKVDWDEFSVTIAEKDIPKIKEILIERRKDAHEMADKGRKFYRNYCTRDKVCQGIIERLGRDG